MISNRRMVIKSLRTAAEVMLKGGYVKGRLEDYKGAHCALGAINKATSHLAYGSVIDTECKKALAEMITEKIPVDGVYDPYNKVHVGRDSPIWQKIFAWSNNICDSSEDVACGMKATAEFLEEEEESATS